MNRQELRLELGIAYFQAMSKIVQFGRDINAMGSHVLAKILPIQTLVHEVMQ